MKIVLCGCSDNSWSWIGRNLPVVVPKLSSDDLQTPLHLQTKGRWPVDSHGQEGGQIYDQHCMTKTHEYRWEIYYMLILIMPSLCLPHLGSPVCISSETKFILVCSSSVPFGIYSVTFKHPIRNDGG